MPSRTSVVAGGRRQSMLDIAAGYYRYYVSVDGQKVNVTIGRGTSGYCLEIQDKEITGDYLERLPDKVDKLHLNRHQTPDITHIIQDVIFSGK